MGGPMVESEGDYGRMNDRLQNIQSVVRGMLGRIEQLKKKTRKGRVQKADNSSSTAIECRGSPGVKNCLFEFGPRTPSPPPAQLREATPPNSPKRFPKEFSPPPRLEREDPPSPRHHFAKDGSPPARGAVDEGDRACGSVWGSYPGPASRKFMAIVRMLERGELPGGIRVDIRAVPPNPWAPLTPMTKTLPFHPWRGKVKRGLHEIGLGLENPGKAQSKSGALSSGLETSERDLGGFEFSFNVASVEPVSPPKDCAFSFSAGSAGGSNPFEFGSAGQAGDKKDDVFVFGKGSG
ncbi:hypothetical protein BSKO_14040 [Bryopsis sp. KO-2023]|nr:hypothetical protein BSKO_14040 [Bryopsis sp. KO-2023]